jgi:hypothetical protein
MAEPDGGAAGGVQKPGWKLTFHDEFDGARLDPAKWDDHYWHGRTHSNGELQYSFPLRPGRLPGRIVAPVHGRYAAS